MRSLTWNKIDIMAAYAEGKKIEVKHNSGSEWQICDEPTWNWSLYNYRVYKFKKHSIDWDQVPDGFDWLYTDIDGIAKVTNSKPDWDPIPSWEFTDVLIKPHYINTMHLNADLFPSFVAGDEETYKDIIQRPKER